MESSLVASHLLRGLFHLVNKEISPLNSFPCPGRKEGTEGWREGRKMKETVADEACVLKKQLGHLYDGNMRIQRFFVLFFF